ncbi:MAG: MFS transporter [Proteobacteria bacterium]|nr:MFS transporter [Pseudomonadota bacterium]
MNLPPALAPLQGPVFRGLWFAWLAANLTMWMNDVAAAWLMTTLTTSPVMVALVSTASTLPVFLLGLPSGALADILDRRRYFAATQLWVLVIALVLAAAAVVQALTAELLLVLTFLNGFGLAMRWPVFAAIVPQVVSKEHLPQSLALNGIAMNLSRVVGPALAGGLLAVYSPAAVFVLNALLAGVAFVLILRWQSQPRTSTLPGERFWGAMRAGINFTLQSHRLRVVMLRVALFFLQATALMSLLPLVARQLHGGGPGTFTVMLSSIGIGAIVAALRFPHWRQRFSRNQFVTVGTLVHAAVTVAVVLLPEVWLAVPAMVVVGMAWISVANSLTVAAQQAMPDWVRARGMSIYQMALMGGSALGSLLWGQVAAFSDVRTAVLAAAALGLTLLLLTRRLSVEWLADIDFSPAQTGVQPQAAFDIGPDEGPVMVTLEYQIDPAQAAEFAAVMARTRRARLRQGALSWGLFRDTAVPGRYIEYFVDENWVEHQRRLERFTAFDAELRAQRLSFQQGQAPPVLRRYVADPLLEQRPGLPR